MSLEERFAFLIGDYVPPTPIDNAPADNSSEKSSQKIKPKEKKKAKIV